MFFDVTDNGKTYLAGGEDGLADERKVLSIGAYGINGNNYRSVFDMFHRYGF